MNGVRQFFVGLLAAAGSTALILAILSTSALEVTIAMLPSPTSLPDAATALPLATALLGATATGLPPSPTTCPVPAGWTAYTVLGGDSLAGLAAQAGISEEEIFRGNCLSSATLVAGSTIYLPLQFTPTATQIRPTDLPTAAPTFTVVFIPTSTAVVCYPPAGWVRYTIQPGDTIFSLARAFGTTVAALRQANCLFGDTIYAGDRIFAPNVPTITPTPLPTDTLPPTEIPTETFTLEPIVTATNTVEPSPTVEPTIETPQPEATIETPGTPEAPPTSP